MLSIPDILKYINDLLTFVSYQKNEELSDPFYYTRKRHKRRDETIKKQLLNLYNGLKNVYIHNEAANPHKLEDTNTIKLNLDDVEDGIFIEFKKNNQRYYIINGDCPLKGVHIDYDEKYVFEDVTRFGFRILEPQA